MTAIVLKVMAQFEFGAAGLHGAGLGDADGLGDGDGLADGDGDGDGLADGDGDGAGDEIGVAINSSQYVAC